MAIPIRRDHSRMAPPVDQVLASSAPTPQLRLSEIAMAALRIIAGLMFMQHGLQKLFGFNVDPTHPMGTPAMLSQLWFAGVLETGGGALIALGLFTRVVALLLAGEMAVAYFQMHFPRSVWPILNQGELAALYCWLFLAYAASGAGRYSLDHVWRRTANT
jgi:putative oxidoreductase